MDREKRDELIARMRSNRDMRYDGSSRSEKAQAQMDEKFGRLLDQYTACLPRQLFGRCPFTRAWFRHTFDPFGLDGPWWHRDADLEIREPKVPPAYQTHLDVAAVPGGHCAAFTALAAAGEQLSSGGADRALIVCVDSLVEVGRLRALDRAGMVRSERSPDGFIPGEGAVALLVQLRTDTPARARAVILVGTPAREPVVDDLRMPSGSGLTEALRAISAADHAEVARRWVLCDLNGSARRHYDWGVAQTRLGWPPHRLTHPADCLGDVGAASGGIQIALACEAFHRGWSPSPAAVAWTACDDGVRAAAVISKESLWA